MPDLRPTATEPRGRLASSQFAPQGSLKSPQMEIGWSPVRRIVPAYGGTFLVVWSVIP
jgi:hypothetical protein